jgi:thymidine phosphorylase
MANAKVGELTAELAKRGEGYRASLNDLDTKREQAQEARMTADLLAAQSKAEAETANRALAQMASEIAALRKTCDDMMEHMQGMTMDESASEDAPVSYRLNVTGRDAAGDLRTVEIIPVERK